MHGIYLVDNNVFLFEYSKVTLSQSFPRNSSTNHFLSYTFNSLPPPSPPCEEGHIGVQWHKETPFRNCTVAAHSP